MLALRMVTARVLVVLIGSFTSQIDNIVVIHWGYTVHNVESQILSQNIMIYIPCPS